MSYEFKKGDKVKIPIIKSIETSIEKCSLLRDLKNQDFVYVSYVSSTGKEVTLGKNLGNSESTFLDTDLELYEEDNFILPEKWCLKVTKDNINFCKELKNRELGFCYDYDYNINGYYSPIEDKHGFKGSLKVYNRTEITFEEFQKYILKNNIKNPIPENESELDKLIRQSKELYNL